MEDRRTAWAIFFSLIVMVMYYQLVFEPSINHGAVPTQPGAVGPIATNGEQTSVLINPNGTQVIGSPTTVPMGHPSPDELDKSPKTTVTNGKVTVEISHLGGRLISYSLIDYLLTLGKDRHLDLIDRTAGMVLPLAVYSGGVDDDHVSYALASMSPTVEPSPTGTVTVPKGTELRLNFTGTLPNGIGITKSFTFMPDSYLFKVEVALSSTPKDGSQLWIEWPHILPVETNSSLSATTLTFLSKEGSVKHVAMQSVVESGSEYGSNKWISIADKYFMTALVPESTDLNTRIAKDGAVVLGRVRGDIQHGSFLFYTGPKDYYVLRAANFDLYRSIDLGWFSFLAYPLLWLLRFFHGLLSNYGLAIILLTLVVKTLMLPLSKASFTSMKAMQELQPELKALRERVTDPSQLNQEIMGLYKRRGVNPLGGCFPALIQIPVFLGLYNALLNAIELRHAPFALWIHDLSAPEGLPLFGYPIPIMVLLMGVSLYVQQLTTPTTSLDPAQKAVMRMMPVIFTVMFLVFPMPAGLVLYWLTNNIISIVQQIYLRSDTKGSPLTATILAGSLLFGLGYVLTLI